MSRHDEVIEMVKHGLNFADIGREFGISRERVRQIYWGLPRPQDPQYKAMLRTKDVACFLGIHINTVRRWSNEGTLKSYRIGSRGDRRFERKDIEDFLEGRNN